MQFTVNLMVYYDGLESFLLTGADVWSVRAAFDLSFAAH
jgi:hypothetical protein